MGWKIAVNYNLMMVADCESMRSRFINFNNESCFDIVFFFLRKISQFIRNDNGRIGGGSTHDFIAQLIEMHVTNDTTVITIEMPVIKCNMHK